MPELDPAIAEDTYPLQAHLGFRMTAWEEDFCRFEMPLQPFHMNRYGIPHGGIHASLLDTVMGFAGAYTGSWETRRMSMTLSLTVNYIAQARGKVLIGEGRRTGGGQRSYFAEGIVLDELGTRIATGSGVFRYRSGGDRT